METHLDEQNTPQFQRTIMKRHPRNNLPLSITFYTVSLFQVPISVDSRATKLPRVHYLYAKIKPVAVSRANGTRCSSLSRHRRHHRRPEESHAKRTAIIALLT